MGCLILKRKRVTKRLSHLEKDYEANPTRAEEVVASNAVSSHIELIYTDSLVYPLPQYDSL